jgi:hypothetical protein
VGFVALNVGHEADAAVIVFILRVIEALGGGEASKRIGDRLLSAVVHAQF